MLIVFIVGPPSFLDRVHDPATVKGTHLGEILGHGGREHNLALAAISWKRLR
jgi:hypothetical protein